MINSERNKFLLIFLCLLIPIIIFMFPPIVIEETRTRIIFFNYFTSGIVVGVAATCFNAVNERIKNSGFIYTIPGFIITAILGNSIRSVYVPFAVSLPHFNLMFNKEHELQSYTLIYGFISEFVSGLILTIFVITLVKAIKAKKVKMFFEFKRKYVIWMLLPFALGLLDYLNTLLFAWVKMYQFQWRGKSMLMTYVLSLTVVLWFVIAFFLSRVFFKNVGMKKRNAVIIISALIAFILFFTYGISYLGLSSIEIIDRVYDNGNSTFMFPILCGGLCALVYKSAFGKSSKLNNSDSIEDNIHTGNSVDME